MTVAALGLAVDSSQVEHATPALQKMAVAAGTAEKAAAQLGRSAATTSGAVQRVGAAATAAERDVATLASRVGTVGTAFERSSSMAVASANRIQAAVTGVRYQTAGLAAQFQDVGVTAAMGMSPLLIGLQQGTQLAGQLALMGNPIKGLGQALLSLLSPVSLLSVGFTALLAVGIQWGASLLSGAQDGRKALADEAMSLDQVKSAINSLSSITDDYARAIRGTAKDQEIATQSILANTEKEFNAKKSLLELELKRQKALIDMQRAELAATGNQLRRDISGGTLGAGVANDVAGGYSDPRTGPFVRSPAQDALLQRTIELIDKSPLNDKMKELRANIDLAEVGTSALEEALKTTFSDSVAASVDRIASTAKTAGDKFRDLVESTKQDVGEKLLEASMLGQTTFEIERQTAALELLGKAKAMDLEITPAVAAEIDRLAEASAEAALALEGAKMEADNMSPFAALGLEIANLNDMLDRGAISWATYQQAMVSATAGTVSGVLGSIGQITGVLSRAFEDNKALAVANAVINTAEGVTKALAQGGIFGFASAAAIGIAGAAQIASILSAKPGSASTAAVPSSTPAATAPASGGVQQSINVTLRGENFSREGVERLLGTITDIAKDGGLPAPLIRVIKAA